MFTHRIDEESNWSGRGAWTGVRGAKTRPPHFSVLNWLVRRVWDGKVPEKLRCEWKTSRKHRVNILTAGKHGKLVENHVLCWRCSCQARKGGKVFFRPMRAVKVDRKVSLVKSERIWWKMDGIAWRVVEAPRHQPEVVQRSQTLLPFLFLKSITLIFSQFSTPHERSDIQDFSFSLWISHIDTLFTCLLERESFHTSLFTFLSLYYVLKISGHRSKFSHIFPFLRFTFNFASKSVRK